MDHYKSNGLSFFCGGVREWSNMFENTWFANKLYLRNPFIFRTLKSASLARQLRRHTRDRKPLSGEWVYYCLVGLKNQMSHYEWFGKKQLYLNYGVINWLKLNIRFVPNDLLLSNKPLKLMIIVSCYHRPTSLGYLIVPKLLERRIARHRKSSVSTDKILRQITICLTTMLTTATWITMHVEVLKLKLRRIT